MFSDDESDVLTSNFHRSPEKSLRSIKMESEKAVEFEDFSVESEGSICDYLEGIEESFLTNLISVYS